MGFNFNFNFNFLWLLYYAVLRCPTYAQSLVGEEVMGKLLLAHVQEFRLKTVTIDQWKPFVTAFCAAQGVAAQLEACDWDAWVEKVPAHSFSDCYLA